MPFFPHIPKADPFELFMAQVAGQKMVYREGNHEITAYLYKEQVFIVAILEIT